MHVTVFGLFNTEKVIFQFVIFCHRVYGQKYLPTALYRLNFPYKAHAAPFGRAVDIFVPKRSVKALKWKLSGIDQLLAFRISFVCGRYFRMNMTQVTYFGISDFSKHHYIDITFCSVTSGGGAKRDSWQDLGRSASERHRSEASFRYTHRHRQATKRQEARLATNWW